MSHESEIFHSSIFTARKRTLRRLCFHRCLSVHRGEGVSAPLHAGIHPLGRHPPGRHPLGRHTPALPSACWDTHPLPSACWDTHPHVQCMLGYGQQAGGTHPTGMHSCYNNCFAFLKSGRTGKYFRDGVEDRSSVESYDKDLQKDVWKRSCRLTNMRSFTSDNYDDISLS